MGDHIPDDSVIDLEIFMDYVISHAGHHLPWCLWVALNSSVKRFDASPIISMFLTIA